MVDKRVMDRTFQVYGALLREGTGDYRWGFERIVDARGRSLRASREFFEAANGELWHQIEANRAMSEELVERAESQREVYRAFVQESVEAWMSLYHAPFDGFRRGLALVEGVGEEVTHAALAVVDDASSNAEAGVEVARGAADAKFPVSGYDALNIGQVKSKVEGLGAAQIRTLRDYEKKNKNRETLIEHFDRKLRAQSA